MNGMRLQEVSDYSSGLFGTDMKSLAEWIKSRPSKQWSQWAIRQGQAKEGEGDG